MAHETCSMPRLQIGSPQTPICAMTALQTGSMGAYFIASSLCAAGPLGSPGLGERQVVRICRPFLSSAAVCVVRFE